MKKIVAALFLVTGILNAQNIQDLNSVSAFSNEVNAGSARYIGMGGSMGALGGDISSTEQNPAGGALAISSDLNVTLGINSYKNDSKFGNSFKTNDTSFQFQNLGANLIFHNEGNAWNRFSIGIKFSQESLNNHISLGRNENISGTFVTNEIPEEFTTYTMDGYQDLIDGYKTKASFDFGASYNEKLFLGLGLNAHDVRYDNYVVFDEDTNGTVYRYDLNGTPYSARATGISLSAGVIGKVNDNFRLGLAYHSPVWYNNVEENYYANLELSDNNYSYDLYYSEYKRNANSRLVASAGFIVGKSFAINADYTLHMNGSTQFKPSHYFTSTNNFLDNNLKSSSEIRVGGEYRVQDFRLRAGYNYVQTPFENISINADMGNGTNLSQNVTDAIRGDINRFSLGAGYDFGGFYLDAAYQFQNQKYNYVFGNADYVDYDNSDQTVYYATLPMNSNSNYVANVKSNR